MFGEVIDIPYRRPGTMPGTDQHPDERGLAAPMDRLQRGCDLVAVQGDDAIFTVANDL